MKAKRTTSWTDFIRTHVELLAATDFFTVEVLTLRGLMGVDDPAWDHSSFSKNRDRLLAGEIAAKFLTAVVAQPRVKRLLSSDHFSVDGTLLEAWASIKSFRRKDGGDADPDGPGRNAERRFHTEKRSNESHRSLTDPPARLYRKGDGQPAKLCYMGHTLMENRNGLAVGGLATLATGTAEREAALALIDRVRGSARRIAVLFARTTPSIFGARGGHQYRDRWREKLRSRPARPCRPAWSTLLLTRREKEHGQTRAKKDTHHPEGVARQSWQASPPGRRARGRWRSLGAAGLVRR